MLICPKCKSGKVSKCETIMYTNVYTQNEKGIFKKNPFHDAVEDNYDTEISYICDNCNHEFDICRSDIFEF